MSDDQSLELMFSILMQKSKDWNYEEEYRFILEEHADSKNSQYKCVNHSEDAIDGVFLGYSRRKKTAFF